MLGSVLAAITASFFGLAMSHSSDEEICPESDKLSVYNMSNGTLDFMCENRDDCNNATVIIGKNTHSVFFGFSGRDSGANSMYSFKDVVAEIECSGRGSCADVVLELLGETLFGDASDSGDGRRRMQDSGGMTCTGKDACNDMEVAVSDTAEFTLNCPETGDDAGCRGITVEASDNAKVSVAIEDAEVAQTMTVTTIGDDAVCTNCEESGVTVVEVEVTTTTSTTTTDDNGGGNGGGDDDMTTTQLEMTTTGDDSVDMTTTGGGGGGSGSGSGSGEDTTAAPGPSEDQDDGDAAYRNNFSLFSLLFLTFVVSFVVFY